jgi:hypothetical protein
VERLITLTPLRRVVYPAAGQIAGALRPPLVGPSPLFTGVGYVAGIVTAESVPVSRPVRLYDRLSGVLVAETLSAADGSYTISGVAANREYLVLAYDPTTNRWNAAPADRITPATA